MGFGIIFVNKDSLGFKIDSPKIYDNIDVVRVANEIKSCGVKNLSSTHGNCSKFPFLQILSQEMKPIKYYIALHN